MAYPGIWNQKLCFGCVQLELRSVYSVEDIEEAVGYLKNILGPA